MPVHMAAYRERGVDRRLRASAIPAWSAIGSHVLCGLVMATIGSAAVVAAAVLIYGAALPVAVAPVFGAFALATLSFQAMGLLLGQLARSVRGAQALGMLLFFPMWLLSGAAPPPSVMSAGMRELSGVLPLTFAVRAIQRPWLGSSARALDLALLAGDADHRRHACGPALESPMTPGCATPRTSPSWRGPSLRWN